MLTVYRVRVATQRYQYFETEDMQFREKVWPRFHSDTLEDEWDPPAFYNAMPKKKEGHFIGFLGGRVFAVAQETLDAHPMLDTFFEQCGELLPFKDKDRNLFAFNCTNCINALDDKKAVLSMTRTRIEKHAFIPARLQFSLFCVPEDRDLLCVEGMSAPHDEFKGYVEQQKLKGLMFEEVWREGE